MECLAGIGISAEIRESIFCGGRAGGAHRPILEWVLVEVLAPGFAHPTEDTVVECSFEHVDVATVCCGEEHPPTPEDEADRGARFGVGLIVG